MGYFGLSRNLDMLREHTYQMAKRVSGQILTHIQPRYNSILNEDGEGDAIFSQTSMEKNYMYKKISKKKLNHLELNMEPFVEMGGRYLFSAVPITKADNFTA